MNKKRVEELTRQFLEEIGFDPNSKELRKTPERVALMLKDIFSSLNDDPSKEMQVFKTDVKNEIILLKDIPFFSFCEHHLLPFFGRIHIAYIPRNGLITGFSNFVSLVKILSRRLQLQERLTDRIADTIVDILNPEGVLIVVEARHLCIEMRGEKPPNTEVTTYSVRGKMKEQSIKESAILMVRNRKGI
ncbi:GTP cyclohydrolase I [candidate division WOR-3 bacterium]|nr:GTP cyclohydrolase I [candidate division WOR-3 bacterium]